MKGTSRPQSKKSKETPEKDEGAGTMPQTPPDTSQMAEMAQMEHLDVDTALALAEASKRVKEAIRRVVESSENEKQEQARTTAGKRIFLEIYEKTNGIVEMALDKAEIPRRTYARWRAEDDEFAQAIVEIDRYKVAVVEDVMMKGIIKGDLPTARWFLERMRRDQYGIRSKVDVIVSDVSAEDEVDRLLEHMASLGGDVYDETEQSNTNTPADPDRGEAEDQK